MMNGFRRTLMGGALIVLLASAALAAAQATDAPPSELEKQLAHVDLGVSGKGQFTSQTSGSNYLSQNVNLTPSNTLGYLVTLRYIKSPLVGLELNYGYARYTDNFTITNTGSTFAGAAPSVLGVQTNVTEYTIGYIVHARRKYFGATPFASLGAGSTAFRPTTGGGQGNQPQARMTYFYSVGAEMPIINDHFGLRATFRQTLENAPDYQQNYWRIYKHAIETEPAFGFYVRF